MENRQKVICGLGALAFVGSSFLAGVWFGKRYSTFVLTTPSSPKTPTTPTTSTPTTPTTPTTSTTNIESDDDAKSSNE